MKLALMMVGLVVGLEACGGGGMFLQPRPATEKRSDIPGTRYTAIATLAADDSRPTLRLSANVRARLNDAGLTAFPASGRWNTEQEAFDDICSRTEDPVQGVLVVSGGLLELTDCETRQTAFEVEGDPSEGGPGIRHITERLIAYLRGDPPPPFIQPRG